MRTHEQMAAMIADYHQSGLSLKSFCDQEQIKLPTFLYWRKKLQTKEQSAFVPISTGSSSFREPSSIELLYPNGVRIRLPHFDPNQIGQLLQLQ